VADKSKAGTVKPGAKPKSSGKTKSQKKSQTKSHTRTRAKAETRTKPETKTRTKPETKTRARSQPQSESSTPIFDEPVSPDEIFLEESEAAGEEKAASIKEGGSSKDSSFKPAIYDPVSAYYQTIRHYPVLTRDEEKKLALKFLKTEDVNAAYTLVTSNLKLVIKIALEYRRLWREIVDLIQEGNVGLMQAVKKYDPYRGVRFSSYAAWWIRAYIIRYIMNNTRMVKIGTTQAQRTLYFQLGKERERLRKMGIEPDSKAIAKSLNLKESEVEEMSMRLSTGDLSLEAKRGHDGDFSLYDTIPALEPDTESRVADAEARSIYLEKLSAFVATLADRDRKIFTMRWMRDDPYTLQQVGEKLGITRERVRQLEARIIKKLREYLEKEGLSASDFFT
jgi:RNA polymerase sigma-32 factor